MPASIERISTIVEYLEKEGRDKTLDEYQVSEDTLNRYVRRYKQYGKIRIVNENKKTGVFNWREWAAMLTERQQLHEKASWSQDSSIIKIETEYPCIVYKPLADAHLGSIGTNYKMFTDISDLFLNTEYLYGSLLGDETDNFVSFKNQLAVLQQIMSPEEQDEFIESWLYDMMPKMLFASYGNHSGFEERVAGKNSLKKMLNRNMSYFNGIGICNLTLNDQKYQIVATHKTRYGSSFNLTHGLKQLARKEIPNADIYLSAHVHQPDMEVAFERGQYQVFMVMGTLKHNDGYAKRDFSYFTGTKDGAFVLDATQHRVIPFPCLDDALEFAHLKNGE